MTLKTYNGPMQGLVYVITDSSPRKDSGSSNETRSVSLCIDASTLPKEKIDILVLTHCHFDHLLAINDIIARDKPEILASEPAAKHLATMDEATLHENAPHIKPVKVTETISEGNLIRTGKHVFRVIETPGHTDGGICLYEPTEQWLFSGDTMFHRGGIGRMDCPTGSISALRKSLDKLSKLEVKQLFPGHSY